MEERRLKRGILLPALALVLASCGGSGSAGAFEDCGLPSPKPDVKVSDVPPEFLLEGTVVRKVTKRPRLTVIALNVPMTITQIYNEYGRRLRPPAYRLITRENEIFEAEIYLQREDGSIIAVQARRALCDEASSVFVQLSHKV